MSNWYVKKGDGEVYGPVTRDELRSWAAEGRVAPEDTLSSDQETWQAAAEAVELGMDWFLELPGEPPYGPLHLMALNELVLDGAVSTVLPIRHRTTGERHVLGDALAHALSNRRETLEEALEVLQRDLGASEKQVEALRAGGAGAEPPAPGEGEAAGREAVECTRLQEELQAARSEIERMAEVQRDRESVAAEVEELRGAVGSLEERARNEAGELQAKLEDAEHRCGILQAQIEDRDGALAEARAQAAALRDAAGEAASADLGALEDRYEGQIREGGRRWKRPPGRRPCGRRGLPRKSAPRRSGGRSVRQPSSRRPSASASWRAAWKTWSRTTGRSRTYRCRLRVRTGGAGIVRVSGGSSSRKSALCRKRP